jgi:hypothetical protein
MVHLRRCAQLDNLAFAANMHVMRCLPDGKGSPHGVSNPARRITSADVHLSLVLLLDAVGTAGLTGLAVRNGRDRERSYLRPLAGIAIIGFSCAAAAVMTATRARPGRGAVCSARIVVATGLVINTAGCLALLALESGPTPAPWKDRPTGEMIGLLVAGDLLSFAYLHLIGRSSREG